MNILPGSKSEHRWTFRRVGGIHQAQLTTVDDLRALETLDPKLWVALSCPVEGLEIDRKTLELIDFDADGRVRIEEMLAAVKWALERLAKPESLFEGGDLPLDAINTSDAVGQALLASAHQILKNMADEDAPPPTHISVDEAANTKRIYGQSRLNGDGIVAEDATSDPGVKKLIAQIIDCLGSETDRGGAPGISLAKLNLFETQLKAYENWWAAGEIDSAKGEDVFPLGDATPEAYGHFSAVEKKIDDYFARCQLAAFDHRAEAPLNRDVSLYTAIAENDFSSHSAEIEQLPLAKISAGQTLPLADGINPQWSERMQRFRAVVIDPLGIADEHFLHPEDWLRIKRRFSGYAKWRRAKPATGVEKLGITRIRELIGSDTLKSLRALLDEDRALAPRMQAVDSVEKLARFHRDLIRILNNFVNFNDFYDEDGRAIFQAGTLFLDGRECRLCLKVHDPAKHAALATLSRAYIVYCECRRKDAPAKFYIAAVFSNGDSANLVVGRNGVFRDETGRLWDTTIERVIENPISVREAFFLPYIRVGRFIGDQLEKWATSRDQAIQKQMETGIESAVAENPSPAEKSAKPSGGIGGVAGMIAAAGIALGAVGAGLGSLFRTMKELAWWELPLVLLALVLMVSLPSMFIAWLKIRKRTLAPLLDASGWAVNGRTLISFRLGRLLTRRAKIPLDAHCGFDERLRVRPWLWFALGFTVIASAFGLLLWLMNRL